MGEAARMVNRKKLAMPILVCTAKLSLIMALMEEEALNAGLTPEQADALNPRQLAEYINNQRRQRRRKQKPRGAGYHQPNACECSQRDRESEDKRRGHYCRSG
jgi:hypothetical protein